MDLNGIINPKQRKRDKKVEQPKMTAPTLSANMWKEPPLAVFTQTSGTNTQPKSTKDTMEKSTQETLLPSKQMKSPTLTYSVLDSLAKRLVLQEKDLDLTTLEAHSFLKSLGFSSTKDPDIFYSKMLKAYLVMTREKLSRQYLGFSPTWGMSINGKFLTAKISAFPKTGRECSLSDILEEKVDRKYFLSEKMTKYIAKKTHHKVPISRVR